jgi:hypothetical protein
MMHVWVANCIDKTTINDIENYFLIGMVETIPIISR